MKTFVRTLWPNEGKKKVWEDEYQRDRLRNYLNSLGFYVLTGVEGSLDVYLIEDDEQYTLGQIQRILKTFLDLTKF